MRRETLLLMVVTASVGLAGCFGGTGTAEKTDDFECKTYEVTLGITHRTGSTWPVYRLNDVTDENGNPRMQEVVAMGFQIDPAGNPDADTGDLEIPNPEIRVKECDTVMLTIINNSDLMHTLHLHGGLVPWTQDGVPFLSQLPVHNGQQHTYVFEDLKAGTYWYHCHVDVAHHIDLGMYGAFIVEEREPPVPVDGDFVIMLDEWDSCHVHGAADPQDPPTREGTGSYPVGDLNCEGRTFQDYYAQGPLKQVNPTICEDPNVQSLPPEVQEELGCAHGTPSPGRDAREWYYTDFPPYTPVYNTFTINGKAFPDTLPIYFEEGNTYRIRIINVGEEWHSMHMHGHSFIAAYEDGFWSTAQQRMDTIEVGPGKRWDIIVEADNPGFWAFHDHVGLNVANDYQSPGGMFTVIGYTGDFADSVGFDPAEVETAIDVLDFTKQYHEEHGDGHEGHSLRPDATTKVYRNEIGQLVIGA